MSNPEEAPVQEEEDIDQELEEMKRRVAALEEIEAESEKLKAMQEAPSPGGAAARPTLSDAEKQEVDNRSVFVGGVDFNATPEELQRHFQSCGTVNRVTILVDKWTGRPKGYAYIEFVDKDSVDNALLLNDTLFKGRQLKVVSKRTNVPGMARRARRPPRPYWSRPPRGRGGGRGRYPAAYSPY